MKDGMFRKGLAVGIIVLFFSISIKSSASIINNNISMPLTNGKTIYVDDDNTQGPWDGTREHPYRSISNGVAAANSNDTVFVFSGLYPEGNIAVEKSIKIIGENKYTTIVDAIGRIDGFEIHGESNTIRGFTIKHASDWIACGIRLGPNSHSNIITGNILCFNSNYGIAIEGYGNIISCNIIKNNGLYGIKMWISSGSLILRNQIENNGQFGINSYQSSAIIRGNNFINNSCNAYFHCTVWVIIRWVRNYWDDRTSFIYSIKGLRWRHNLFDPDPIEFESYGHDWFPARKPYDITATELEDWGDYAE